MAGDGNDAPGRIGVPSVDEAQGLTTELLGGNLERLRHSAAVAARAEFLAYAVIEADTELLVTAAWLLDIGYASALQETSFHPLDGARYLRSEGWDRAVATWSHTTRVAASSPLSTG